MTDQTEQFSFGMPWDGTTGVWTGTWPVTWEDPQIPISGQVPEPFDAMLVGLPLFAMLAYRRQ